MKKVTPLIVLLSVTMVLTSCYSLEQVSIDYLTAADINLPSQIRRVGVVNNVSALPDNYYIGGDTLKSAFELARKTTYSHGDPVIATESLAEAIAEQNYFDAVIICDSALRAGDIHPRESTLSTSEVSALTKMLNADIIVALEEVQIKSTRIISVIPGGGFWGTVDAKMYPVVKLYLPSRKGPLAAIQPNDSIFWEDTHYSDVRLRAALVSEEEVMREASEYAGKIPVKHLAPHWKTVKRYYYSEGSSELRDAAVFVRNGEFDKARELWEKAYAKKSDKNKMRAAFNLALSYEMSDNLDAAEEWIGKALDMSKTIGKTETVILESEEVKVSTQVLYTFYAEELKKRKDNMTKLNIQLERFNSEN